jgi:hypothetical protein
VKTTDRLAEALRQCGCYDDFKSESPTPIADLVRDCRANGLPDIAERAIAGEFDATREESQAWARTFFGGTNDA